MIVTSAVYDILKSINVESSSGDFWDGPQPRRIGPHRLATYSTDWARVP
jgi:hypothetical protein